MKKYKILKTTVDFLDYKTLINKIITNCMNNQNLTVAPIASHPVVESIFSKKLQTSLNSFNLVLPDGQSLVWAVNFLYRNSFKERIYGPDLLLKLCSRCEKEKIKTIFCGNRTDLVNNKIKIKYPKLKTIVLPDLNYKKVNNTDVNLLSTTLSKYKKSIIFIGIGSPAQHLLLTKLKQIEKPIIAVGAAFDFISGAKKQAPAFFQRAGLEWLFRLINEPRRLWKRYLIYAPLFIFLVFLQKYNLLTKKHEKNN
ncbi:hypothetical protein COY88_03945 [Candidatus Roizmanbacteria bacterium CG_4_10_14_0_8_um_filter_35_28]|uniref:Glycosyltransferase n=1 Tax=Candidatus Roizmanbacteria bacterium CG_4_10_14_0_8_um_filter_35_28 TaxID=1974827 RepID=A0A2M7QEK8_9BACT|nr:MAG: hypothetical protein COY88_03945 [Candidatus Roizmanbacteria bacterium CG_4_10_14_0_8_um_filter_35_28]PJC82343.1 MAG: hypothetical protein CO006_04150 [Candidatus Roizmanbacteria bacterium CG_4_8_14_3_um_filter_35_14]